MFLSIQLINDLGIHISLFFYNLCTKLHLLFASVSMDHAGVSCATLKVYKTVFWCSVMEKVILVVLIGLTKYVIE